MTKLSKDILGRIKKAELQPRPKWYFYILHGLVWGAVIFTLLFAALSSAIVIRHLAATDWELARSISGSTIKSVLQLLPFLWLSIIILLIFAGDSFFRKTRKGHRFSTFNIILASVLVSLVLGTGLFAAEADKPFEKAIRKNVRPYETWVQKRQQKFVAPDRGAIAGEVKEVTEKDITIRDFRDREWKVDTSESHFFDKHPPKVGEKVGIIGEKVDEKSFRAGRVKTWERVKDNLEKALEKKEEMRQDIRKDIRERRGR